MRKYVDNWNGFKVHNFEFDGTRELCDYVKRVPLNTRRFTQSMVKDYGSEGSDKTFQGGGWYKTKNLKHAIKLCENGWNEGFDFFKTLKRSLEATGDRIYFFPADETDTVNLFVNLSYNWETREKAIVNRGIIIQNLIRQLEENYYKVNLNAFVLNFCGNEILDVIVKLKDKNEKLDPKKAYFAFCNPSFLRRLIFRILESADLREKEWTENYGYPCDSDTIKKFFKTTKIDIVIPQASEIGINGNSINEDWNTFLKYANLRKYFND
jgi:hypothetical protein